MTQLTNLERQIAAIEKNVKLGKAKNIYAANNKIINLKAQLAATRKANIWKEFLAK